MSSNVRSDPDIRRRGYVERVPLSDIGSRLDVAYDTCRRADLRIASDPMMGRAVAGLVVSGICAGTPVTVSAESMCPAGGPIRVGELSELSEEKGKILFLLELHCSPWSVARSYAFQLS